MIAEEMKATILLFHRVHPLRDPLWDPMPPELFEKILGYVSKRYTILPLKEYFFQASRKYRKPILIVTFDDGYRDFIEYALPILKKHSIPAAMFIVTDCVEKDLPTWTYIIDYLFSNTEKLKLKESDFNFLNNIELLIRPWKNREERINYYKKFRQQLKKMPNIKRKIVINQLIQCFNDIEMPRGLMLSWKEINQIKSAGIEIGSHTVTHPPLATIEDEKELKFELLDSAALIKEKTGEFPVAISYPVSSYNQRVKNMSKQVGYNIGLAVDQDIYDSISYDNFQIPRLDLYNENFFKAKLRINGVLAKLKKILQRYC